MTGGWAGRREQAGKFFFVFCCAVLSTPDIGRFPLLCCVVSLLLLLCSAMLWCCPVAV